MATPAQQRATAKYKAKKRAERVGGVIQPGKRTPSAASQAWKTGAATVTSLPPAQVYCDRCESFGHSIDQHLSPSAWGGHHIPTDGRYNRHAGAE